MFPEQERAMALFIYDFGWERLEFRGTGGRRVQYRQAR